MDADEKGLLDVCVLHVLKKEDTYGYKLTQEITKIIEVSESALYPVLDGLNIKAYWKLIQQNIPVVLENITGSPQQELKLNALILELKDLKKVINIIIMDGENNE